MMIEYFQFQMRLCEADQSQLETTLQLLATANADRESAEKRETEAREKIRELEQLLEQMEVRLLEEREVRRVLSLGVLYLKRALVID